MALRLPSNVVAPTAAEASRLGPMKAGGLKIPKTPKAPKKTPKGGGAPPFDPYAGLLLKPAYAPGSIQSTATSGYNTDVANANQLAAMGLPSNDELTQQAAARAEGLAQISKTLQDHLAQIQQATVAQGNQGAIAVADQNQQASHTGGAIPGAPQQQPVQTPMATLAGQTAGAGNVLGAQEAGAGAYGAYLGSQAINQGASAIQQNDLNRQKALAQFLSGVAPVSARVSSMEDANQKVSAANVATEVNIGNQIEQEKAQAILEGDKAGIAAADRKEKAYEADLRAKTQTGIANAANQTKIQTSKTAADATTTAARTRASGKGKGAGGLTPATRASLIAKVAKTLTQRAGGKSTSTQTARAWSYSYAPVGPDGKTVNPLAPTVHVTSDSPPGTYKPPAGNIVTAHAPSSYKTTKSVTGRPGYYRLYNEGIATLKAAGFTQAEAETALRPVYENVTKGLGKK